MKNIFKCQMNININDIYIFNGIMFYISTFAGVVS